MRLIETIWNTSLTALLHCCLASLLLVYNCMTTRGKRSVADSLSRVINRRQPVKGKRRR
ncbi:MAG: hypothetical protein JNL58_04400 [Planctomyces sp.]|nr:hypothetical protein [Planctomyces sp.]